MRSVSRAGLIVIVLLLPRAARPAEEQAAAADRPRVFQLDGRRVVELRRQFRAGDAAVVAAIEPVRARADRALGTKPGGVVEKPWLPPSGDPHDYLSMAPYFWPDPSKPDGRPYIRRDGRTNPERNKFDAPRLGRMTEAVVDLALAYGLTGHEPYAEHAARLLRAWFLDPETRMNPNLNFGQFIPGRNDGRGAGLIETRRLIEVIDAVGLIELSPAWTERDGQALRGWFRAFLDWMRTSKVGRDEAAARNNHGSWYDAQQATFALFVGDDRLARAVLEAVKSRRLAEQIEPDGRQPRELGRTKSYGYCLFNLDALTALAALGGKVGVDLWHYATPDGRSIRRAIDYLIPFALREKPWPHEQLDGLPVDRILPLLRRAAGALPEPAYERAIDALGGQGVRLDRTFGLLRPAVAKNRATES